MKTGVELLPLPQHRIERIHSPERSAEVSLLAETRALACRWTLGLVALICVLNFGLFNGAAGFSGAWPTGLQFDETAVRDGSHRASIPP